MISEFAKNGYFVFKDAIDVNVLNFLKNSIFDVFDLQGCESRTDRSIVNMFQNNFDRFLGCANACQNLLGLHSLSCSDSIVALIKKCGINYPNINTRPLLFFSCKSTSKSSKNWKLEPHQDWPSTLGSINGLTVWMPLQDTDQSLGCLEIVPQSHKLGYLAHKLDDVPYLEDNGHKFVPIEMKLGDVLVFNWFCIHRSGTNIHEDKIRFAAHFRYNDLAESSYIERNYFRNRIDKVLFDCNPSFPSPEQVRKFYEQ
jgi:hypothetical protein